MEIPRQHTLQIKHNCLVSIELFPDIDFGLKVNSLV